MDLPILWKLPDQHVNSFSRSALFDVIIKQDVAALRDSFYWLQTPEGHDYWADRAESIVPLTARDVEQLMVWYALLQGTDDAI